MTTYVALRANQLTPLTEAQGDSNFSTLASAIDHIANPLLKSSVVNTPWDNFDVVDGTLLQSKVTPSGHTWWVDGAGGSSASITNFGYTTSSNTYATLTDTNPITEMECSFWWNTPGSNTAPVLCLYNGGNLQAGMLHMQLTPTGFSLLSSLTGAASLIVPTAVATSLVSGIPPISGGYYGGRLRQDGTKYKARLVANLSANTLTVYLPDGQIILYSFTTAGYVANATGNSCFWQNTGDNTLLISDCSTGKTRADDVLPVGVGRSNILNSVNNTLLFNRLPTSPLQNIIGTTAGWYTIATHLPTYLNQSMNGVVRVWGSDGNNRHADFIITIGSEGGLSASQSSISVKSLSGQWAGGVVQYFRLSQDSSGNIQLDINLSSNNVSGTNLYAIYDGAFTPVLNAVVGANPLATWNTLVKTFPPAPRFSNTNVTTLTGIPSVGWYTVATQTSTISSFASMYLSGEVYVFCVDQAGRGGIFKIQISKSSSGVTPVLTQLISTGGTYGGWPIDMVRVTQDDTNHLCNLDVHFNGAVGVGAVAEFHFEGYFSPVSTIVSGATVYPTTTTTLTIS